MAEGPLDYSGAFAPQSPVQALASGYQLGQGIRDDFQQQQALRTQQEQAQAERMRQGEVINSLIANKNATAQDYANASLLLPTTMRESIKQSFELKNTAQQESQLRNAGQALSAIISGRPDIAVQQLQRQAEIGEKSGMNPAEVQALRTNAQVIEANPEYARSIIGTTLASIPGGDKVLTALGTAGKEQREAEQAPADLLKKQAEAKKAATESGFTAQKMSTDIANVQSQIEDRAGRLALDRDKLTSEVQGKVAEIRQKAGELPAPVMKNIDEATTNSIAAKQSATKMLDLADQIDKANLSSGVTAKAGELWKRTFGSQDELSRIRGDYSRIVTPAAMAAYKQVATGTTSDKDVETAMVGVPKDTESPERMASFLRGVAKLQQYDSALENAKSEWYAGNKFLGKSRQDMEIDGIQVPSGTTFKDFSEKYVKQKVGRMEGDSLVDRLGAKYGSGATGGR